MTPLSVLDAPRWTIAHARVRRAIARVMEAERDRLILWLPVCMGTGVLIYYGLRFEPPSWLGPLAAAIAGAVAIRWPERPVLRAAALAIAVAATGFAAARFATARAPPIERDLPMHAIVLSGTVSALEALPAGRRVTLSAVMLEQDGRTPRRTVRLRLKAGDPASIGTGDRVRVRAMIRPPPPPAFPGAWDTRFEAFFSGIGAYGSALDRLEILTAAPPDGWAARVQRLRERIAARVTAAIPGAPGAVAVTLLTGAARGIPEADHEAFRQSGLAHLLAVAGLHIGIVMGCGLLVARTALALSAHASLFWPTKQIAAVAALAAGGGYMILTGAHVPIVRSFAMACLFTLAVLTGRRPLSLRGLGLAGIVLMLIAPHDVPGVSFQMSFSAVLALISGYEALRPRLRGLHRTPIRAHVAALGLTSTLAGTASMPFGAYHFGHIQTYYILSNMVAVPLTAFWVMPAGLLGLALMPLGLERLALVPMGWGASLVIGVARITTALPGAQLAVPAIPGWGLAVLSLGLAWLGIWRTRLRLLGLIAILAGGLSPLLDRPPDILVSSDGGMIGFRTEHGALLQQTRRSSFTHDAWAARWNRPDLTLLPAAGTEALPCAGPVCTFRPRFDLPSALLFRGPERNVACDGVAVVVSAEPARGVCYRPGVALVDRFTVWRDGPAAIWISATGARVVTDRSYLGDRPWVPPRPGRRLAPVSPPPDDGQ